jgi:hypothetical protein
MLFLVLFAFGFMTARIAGINFWMQLGYLARKNHAREKK